VRGLFSHPICAQNERNSVINSWTPDNTGLKMLLIVETICPDSIKYSAKLHPAYNYKGFQALSSLRVFITPT